MIYSSGFHVFPQLLQSFSCKRDLSQLFSHTDFPLVMNSFSQLIVFLSLQILFMNKIDLFQDKILHSGRHLRLYLPQFKGRIDIH